VSKLFPIRSSSGESDQREPELLELDDDRTDEVFDALGSETARQILLELHEGPQPASELAAAVETTIQNVQYHLTKLQAADLVSVVDTWHAANGAEMDVYAPTDEALVLFAGTEPERSLRKLLKRLVGVLAPLALGATALALWFDRNEGSGGSGIDAPPAGSDGGNGGVDSGDGIDGGNGAGGAPSGDGTPSAAPERAGSGEGTLHPDTGDSVVAPENATATDAAPTESPTDAANGTVEGVVSPGSDGVGADPTAALSADPTAVLGADPTALLGADPALVAAVFAAAGLVALGTGLVGPGAAALLRRIERVSAVLAGHPLAAGGE